MPETEKSPRRFIDIRSLTSISLGAFGAVYALSDQTILKCFAAPNVEVMAIQEYERARKVADLGIPCAAPLEIVDTEMGAALVYERFANGSLARNLRAHPDKLMEYVGYFADLARKLANTVVPGDLLPNVMDLMMEEADHLGEFLDRQAGERYKEFLRGLPGGDRFLHRDLHFSNVMPTDSGAVLIDLPDAAKGHPIFDLISTASIYYLFPKRDLPLDPEVVTRVLRKEAPVLWDAFILRYFEGLPKSVIEERKWALEMLSPIAGFYPAIKLTPPEDIPVRSEEMYKFLDQYLIANQKELHRIAGEWKLK